MRNFLFGLLGVFFVAIFLNQCLLDSRIANLKETVETCIAQIEDSERRLTTVEHKSRALSWPVEKTK